MLTSTRRRFLGRITTILTVTAGTLAGISLLRQAIPRLSKISKRIKIGRPNQFPMNMYTYLAEGKLFIYRDHEGISAVSAICTHLGCVIERTEDGFQCPCHGSCYDNSGGVISGAASKDLPWYELVKGADGQLIVDLSSTVDPGHKLYVS